MIEPLPTRHDNATTRSMGIAYVVFARPSVDKATAFLRDFGIDLLSRDERGAHYGSTARQETFYVVRQETKARFVGLAMYVEAEADLRALIREGFAKEIEAEPAPNGHPYVRMTDLNGVEVHAVVRAPVAPKLESDAAAEGETPNSPHRTGRVDEPFAAPHGVPRVARLGHAVMETTDLPNAVDWYQRVFGLLVSDVQVLPDGTPVVAFCRCDLGDQPTDHHTVALGQTFRTGFEHAAFEVETIEAVTRGQHHLRERGWKHSWGVGRHIMGSQVFDYWYDAYGAKHEHYADGDIVTASYPMGRSPFGPAHLAQWGPPMPANFIGGPPSAKVLVDLVRFAASRKLPLSRLVDLIKAAKFSERRIGNVEEKEDRHAAR
ncbi:MAG: VOC family protein [Polyangiales bacterium]